MLFKPFSLLIDYNRRFAPMNSKQSSLFGFLNKRKPNTSVNPPEPPQHNAPSRTFSDPKLAPIDSISEEVDLPESTSKGRLRKKVDLKQASDHEKEFVVPTPQKAESEEQDVEYEKFMIGTMEQVQEKEMEKIEEKNRGKRSKKEKQEKMKPMGEEEKKRIREEFKRNQKQKASANKTAASLLDEIERVEDLNSDEENRLLMTTYQLKKDQNQIDKDHEFAQQLADQEQREYQISRKKRQEEEVLPKEFQRLSILSQGPKKEAGRASMHVEEPPSKAKKEPPRKASRSKSKEKSTIDPKGKGNLDCFGGMTFVMTGDFKYDKNMLENIITKFGGRVTGSVSGKTTFLLQGYGLADGRPINTSGNSVKAITLKKPIILHDNLESFFKDHTGSTLSQLLGIKPKPVKAMVEAPETLSKEDEFALWCQRFAPKNLDDVIGQEGAINKARKWIEGWENVHYRGNKHNIQKNFSAGFFYPKGDLNSKAMMFSGPPGIGKTTAARLLAKENGYRVVEYNASDTRNKSSVSTLQASSYSLNFSKEKQKILMILDEVDGLSGGDRGGSAAMIQLIKKSHIPIICICNDRQNPKIKSLGGHCYDVSFEQPGKEQVLNRLTWILKQKGMNYSKGDLMEIIESFHSDMRQILNFLNMHCLQNSTNVQSQDAKASNYTKYGTSQMNMWDASNKLLNRVEFNELRMPERLDLFFVDSQFVPLIVQNCLRSTFTLPRSDPKANKNKNFELMRLKYDYSHACDSIAFGDIINRSIRKNQDWKLMPIYGYLSSVFPTQICAVSGKAVFPQWLGNNSKAKKISRELRELENSFKWTSFGGSRKSTRNYAQTLYLILHKKLKESENEKGSKKQNTYLNEAVGLMSSYRITPTMLKENMIDVQYNGNDLMGDIPTAVKTSLTKLYNERYNASKTTFTKAKAAGGESTGGRYDPMMEEIIDDQQLNEEEEEEESQEAVLVQKPKGKAKPKTKSTKALDNDDD